MASKDDFHHVSLKQAQETKTDPILEQTVSPQNNKRRLPAATNAWIILFLHGGCCLALALAMAFGLDGYQAGDDSTPHYIDGHLVLRVSDITTMVSVALVVIKIVAGSWSSIVLWASARHLRASPLVSRKAVSRMVRWKLPPWFQNMRYMPRDVAGWTISVALVTILVQAFIAPILTGSVDWNSTFRTSNTPVSVRSADPAADFGLWKWYFSQGWHDKVNPLRKAAGYTNIAWADPSNIDTQGKSVLGNGCRHVVNQELLPVNSTLVDAILPCINIHNIRWYKSEEELPEDEWNDLDGKTLSLVNEDPTGPGQAGVTLIFDIKNKYHAPETHDQPPAATRFSGTLTVILLLHRRHYETEPERCDQLSKTIFGDLRKVSYLIKGTQGTAGDENCRMFGKIDFTAGVTQSRRATYISPRVVEDQTPIQDVVFTGNKWVQDAIWLLPDLLTMTAIMNATQIPTYDNIDGYVSGMLRQGYLGAWDMLSHSYEDPTQAPMYQAYEAQKSLTADVSLARVFAWLALCLLMTISGVSVLIWGLGANDLKPLEKNDEGVEEVAPGIGQEIVDSLLRG